MNTAVEVGDRVIYHDPGPARGKHRAVVRARAMLPSGMPGFELDIDDPRPGDPPFRFAKGAEIHRSNETCGRCSTDLSVEDHHSGFPTRGTRG